MSTFIDRNGYVRYQPKSYAAERKNACELCGTLSSVRVIDHCHIHGWIRGVSCSSCNNMLMPMIEHHVMPSAIDERFTTAIEHWRKCPDCVVNDWEPFVTYPEWEFLKWSGKFHRFVQGPRYAEQHTRNFVFFRFLFEGTHAGYVSRELYFRLYPRADRVCG